MVSHDFFFKNGGISINPQNLVQPGNPKPNNRIVIEKRRKVEKGGEILGNPAFHVFHPVKKNGLG